MMQQASVRDKRAVDTPAPDVPRPQRQRRRRGLRNRKPRVQHERHDHDPKEERIQHELAELKETHDLDDIDDDVEEATTLLEWQAPEHVHRPKSPRWFVGLAATTTILVGLQIAFYFNAIGAAAIAVAGGLVYYIAQRKPEQVRYRIMMDGIAMNTVFYHWRDLRNFNVIYEPGETKTVLVRGERRFAPLLHMEIGDADPVEIRNMLIEFLPEDQELEEPLVDILARRLGF